MFRDPTVNNYEEKPFPKFWDKQKVIHAVIFIQPQRY